MERRKLAVCLERGNHYFKVVLNAQKSAEAIVCREAKGRISRSLEYDRERGISAYGRKHRQ